MAQASVEDVQWTLFLGALAARALFAAADLGYRNDHFIEPMSESVEVELGGKLFSIPPVNGEAPTLSGLSDTSWFQGFYLACIAREAKALARLASPMDYRLAIGDRRSRAVNAAVVGLQALWRDEPELVLKSTKDWADLSDFPWSRFEVPAATAIVNGDSDSLNNALFEMLSAHKAFYDTEKNMFDDHGWLAARPLIFACIAHDRGLSIEVESGYMPKSFVTDELK